MHDFPSFPSHGAPGTAIFIHGFATSPLDMKPLAAGFERRGLRCRVLNLSGHTTATGASDGLQDIEPTEGIDTWLGEVRAAVDEELLSEGPLYLVGFSFGASLALAVASDRKVDGVLCVSLFRRPTRPWTFKFAALFPRFPPVGNRRPRVSSKSTRKFLGWTRRVPMRLAKTIVEQAPELSRIPRDTRVLLIHSIDDPIADYTAVAEEVQRVSPENARLVSLSGRNWSGPAGRC